MLASQLVQELQALIAERGDFSVLISGMDGEGWIDLDVCEVTEVVPYDMPTHCDFMSTSEVPEHLHSKVTGAPFLAITVAAYP